jgi:hypothetical protein
MLGGKTIKALLADPPGRDWYSISVIPGRNSQLKRVFRTAEADAAGSVGRVAIVTV